MHRQANHLAVLFKMKSKSNHHMKTIFCIYSNTPVAASDINKFKKYCFNSEIEANGLKVGDRIASSAYNTPIQVVEILPVSYRYVNIATGELSDILNSTNQFEIRPLVMRTDTPNVVYGQIIEQI
jgi:hypothetical protein